MRIAIERIGDALDNNKSNAKLIFVAEVQHLEQKHQASRGEAIAMLVEKASDMARKGGYTERSRDAALNFLTELALLAE